MIGAPDGVEVPTDIAAERTVAGTCIMSPAGADLARQRLDSQVWYDQTCRRVFLASQDITVIGAWYTAPYGEAFDRRLEAIAMVTGISRSDLEQMVAEAPVAIDTSGTYANRIVMAARRRYLMTLAADMHNLAAAGPLERLAALTAEAHRVTG